MIVTCTNCQAKFKVADDKVGAKGAKVRCSKCQTVFVVRKDGSTAGLDAPPAAATAAVPLPAPRAAAAPPPASPPPLRKPGADPFGLGALPPTPAPAAAQVDPFAPFGPAPTPSSEQVTRPLKAPPTAFDVDLAFDESGPRAAPPPLPAKDPFRDVTVVKTAPPEVAAAAATGDPFAARSAASDDPFAMAGPPSELPPPAELHPPSEMPPPSDDPFAAAAGMAPPPVPHSDPFAPGADPFATAAATPADPFAPPAAGAPSMDLDLASGTPPPVPAAPPASGDPFASLDLASPAPVSAGVAPSPPEAFQQESSGLELGGPSFEAAAGDRSAFGTNDGDLSGDGHVPPPPVPPAAPAFTPAPAAEAPHHAAPAPAVEAEAPPPVPRPRQGAMRLRPLLVNSLSLAVLLAATLGIVVVWRNDGRFSLDEFKPAAIVASFHSQKPAAAGAWIAAGVTNGLYDTKDGGALLFVRGQVVPRGNASAGPVKVTVELVDGDKVVATADALAGAVPSPEDLWLAARAADVAAAAEKAARSAPPARPGQPLPFLVAFASGDYPSSLAGITFRVLAAPASPTASR